MHRFHLHGTNIKTDRIDTIINALESLARAPNKPEEVTVNVRRFYTPKEHEETPFRGKVEDLCSLFQRLKDFVSGKNSSADALVNKLFNAMGIQ